MEGVSKPQLRPQSRHVAALVSLTECATRLVRGSSRVSLTERGRRGLARQGRPLPRLSAANRDFDGLRLDAEGVRQLPLGLREGEDARRGVSGPPRRRLLLQRHRLKRHLVEIDPEVGEGPVAHGIAPLIPGLGKLDPRVLAKGDEPADPGTLMVVRFLHGRNPPEQEAHAVRFCGIRKLRVGVMAILGAEQPGALLRAGGVEHPRLRTALTEDAFRAARRQHHDGVGGGGRLAGSALVNEKCHHVT